MQDERRILSGTEENPITVAETRWNADGSRVESFQDYRTGEAHFTVYNAQGEMVESAHGYFTVPEKPEPTEQPVSTQKWERILQPPAEDSLDWKPERRDEAQKQVSLEPERWDREQGQWSREQKETAREWQLTEFSRPPAVAAVVFCGFYLPLSLLGSTMELPLLKMQAPELFAPALLSLILGLIRSAAVLVLLTRLRKDRIAGVCLGVRAATGLASMVFGFDLLSVLDAALSVVMAVDCFVDIRLSAKVKTLLYGWGKAALCLVTVGQLMFTYYHCFQDFAFHPQVVIWSYLTTVAENLPGILLGFALAGAKRVSRDEDSPEARGYIGMGVHVLMSLFSLGVWNAVWVYRTTQTLNRLPQTRSQLPLENMLLYLFIPFYSLVWYFRQGKRAEEYAGAAGLPRDSSFGTVCLTVGIFLPCLSVILIQNKINQAARAAA